MVKNFNFSSMDWDAYVKFRPVYPEELYSIIYAYHDSHRGGYDSAVDIGAGIGVVSAELLHKFSHVTVTDAAETYVAQAKALFSKNCPPEVTSFLQSKAEDIDLEALPRKGERVDLVTAAECLHWSDVEIAGPRIASILKPGGTFAAWVYGVRPILLKPLAGFTGDFSELENVFYGIYDEMSNQYESRIEPATLTSAGASLNARLDHMDLPSDVWTDVRRTHTHVDYPMVHGDWPSRASTAPADRQKFQNEKLLYHEADYEYLEGYLVNWIPPIKVKEFAAVELARLQEIMGTQKIGITWPFALILATKT